jgi:hypothetical protein
MDVEENGLAISYDPFESSNPPETQANAFPLAIVRAAAP